MPQVKSHLQTHKSCILNKQSIHNQNTTSPNNASTPQIQSILTKNAFHLHPLLPILPLLLFIVPISAVFTAVTAAATGGGPILPHPGFVTLEADPPNVILLAPPFPSPPLLTGESLALLPMSGSPFSLLPILPAENTRFARPGEFVTVPRRFVPRRSVEKSAREDLGRRGG